MGAVLFLGPIHERVTQSGSVAAYLQVPSVAMTMSDAEKAAVMRYCADQRMPLSQLPRPTRSPNGSLLEGGASSVVAGSACRPHAWTGLVASERFTTGEPFRSPVATPHPVSGMWGGIQTGWLRHAHLIDSDLYSIPIRGAEKPAPVGAGWHARFSGPVLRGWLTGSLSQPTLLAD